MKFVHRGIVATIIFLLINFSGHSSNKGNGDRPNILLILSDDHSMPYLGCYGNTDLKTPNLDNLAANGVLFNHAYTTAPQCVPSRASILTGRSVVDIRMSRFSAPLSRDVLTIPEYLRTSGYFTGICGRHYHLDGSVRKPPQTDEAFEENNLVTFPDRVEFIKTCPDEQVSATFSTFLEEVPGGKPFFMWMNFSDPHRRFTAVEYEPKPSKLKMPASMPDVDQVRKDLSQHYGEIMRLDTHIGQIVNILKEKSLFENTMIVFMGDNGAALLRGKGTLYDMGLHVPLLVHWPDRIKKPMTSDAMISGEDIAPTIIASAGLEAAGSITGQSFLPLLTNREYQENEFVFAARGPHSSGLPLHTAYFDMSRTVFNKKYKLIYNAVWQQPYAPVDFVNHPMWKKLKSMHESGGLDEKFSKVLFSHPRAMFELYDLEKDPDEMNNLMGNDGYESISTELKTRLHKWMIVNQDHMPLPIAP
ncbi:MAG: sulfatase [Cyclobacteriaceae bacterium]